MGSVLNKIAKKAEKFHNSLKVLEKHLATEENKQIAVDQPFDLTKVVETDLFHAQDHKRKLRNKKKAKRKK